MSMIDMNPPSTPITEPVSKCCHARLLIRGATTHYYTCSLCNKLCDPADFTPAEQPEGSALERLIEDYETECMLYKPHVLKDTQKVLVAEARAESTTLHKLVGEMVEAMEEFPAAFGDVGDKGGTVYIKDWERFAKQVDAVLAKAKLEIGGKR